jgi:hypothetical protein
VLEDGNLDASCQSFSISMMKEKMKVKDDVTENDEVQGQKRCVKLLVTTSARGKVSSVVIIVKDSCFQHVDVHLFPNLPIFLVSVPKVKVVVDSEGESPSNNDSNEKEENDDCMDSEDNLSISSSNEEKKKLQLMKLT